MRHKLHRAILAVFLTIGIVLSTVSVCHAQDTQLSYQLLERVDGSITYELNVVIPQTLLQYYADKRTSLRVSNFPDFVTPYALEPIASCLWQIYKTDEDFTNGVLMLVHQITYEETTPAKYPVETMVEQKGDCDLFSFIAASILEAGGIHVILLYYESLTHMNIGVQLSEAPRDVRDSVYYVTSGGTKYYIAECTGGNWKEGWRVGECPDDCKQASSKIYTLDNTESIAPGQVSASFNALERSTMSIEISPAFLFENSAVTVRGQISPGRADRNVTIYAKFNFSSWRVVGTTLTKPEGNFEYRWVVDTAGLCEIQASWSGDDQYTGSMSLTRNAIVVPFVIVVLVGVSILVIVVSVVAITISRQARGQVPSNGTSAVTASVFANDL